MTAGDTSGTRAVVADRAQAGSGRDDPGRADHAIPTGTGANPAPSAAIAPAPPTRRTVKRRHRSGIGGRLALLVFIFILAGVVYAMVGKPVTLPVWAVAEIELRLNRAVEKTLPDAALAVGGIEVTVGDDWVPHLRLEDVRLLQNGGETLLSLPETLVSLSPAGLLHGDMQVQNLKIVGARLAVRRDKDGHFDIALGGRAGPQISSLAALFTAADLAFAQEGLAQLTRIDAEALSITLTDLREGRTWEVGDGRLSFENRPGELAAELGMSLVAGGAEPSRAVLTVVAAKGAASARITVQVDQVAARDLASQTALLAPLGVLDAPISGQIAATVDVTGIREFSGRLEIGAGALRPNATTTPIAFDTASLGLGYDPDAGRIVLTDLSVQSETLRLKATGRAYMVDAAGQTITGTLAGRRPAAFLGQMAIQDMAVDPAGLFQQPVEFSQGAADIRLQLDPFAVDIGQVSMVEGAQTLHVSGKIAADAGGWRTALDVSLNEVSLQRLLALWPVRLVPGTRQWVADNVRNAELANVRAAVRIAPGQAPGVEFGYEFAGAQLRFMNQMPPATGADGYSTIVGQTYTLVLSKGIVTPPQGGPVDVTGTIFSVPDILAHPARADIRMQAAAPLTAMLSLLDQPPFNYMAKAAQPVELGQGQTTVQAHINLPLVPRIGPGDVTFQIAGQVRDFASDLVIKGRTVTAPLLTVTATEAGMAIAGQGLVGQVPFDMIFAQDFGLSPGPARVNGTVNLSQRAVEEFGLGLPKAMVTGDGIGQVAITLPKDAPGQLRLTSDLRGITLAIPELGWRKGPNTTGRLEADVTLGSVPQVNDVQVSGAGLTARGKVRLKADGGLDVAEFSNVSLGGWLNGAVKIIGRGAGRAVGLAVTSGTIDIRKFPSSRGSSGSADGSPIAIDLASLRITDGIRLNGFSGKFTLKGGFNGDFTGRVNGKAPLSGTVVPSPNGPAVRIRAEDAGAVMKAAAMFSSARGGALDLTLVPRVNSGDYDGQARISGIRVNYGSVMADLLSAISIIGLLDQLNGDGIVFNTAQAEFLMTPDAIDIQKGSAVGASMGVSVQGIYHSDTMVLDMTGVVSPIYLLNGIGSILTRKGEGLFGFAYRLKGTAAEPDVQVNPLSILTPGMFRDLFRAPPPTLEGG
ncbi:MAG: hypothetical protein H7245_21870 [Candidatus Saccharibacteria bacterium]|nr:hypothetical protein [Pseudorhodobacter sp.]